MTLAQTAWAALALAAPGLLVLRFVPNSLSRLEAVVVALAIGRVLLSGLALLGSGTGWLGLLIAPFAAAVVVQLVRSRQQLRGLTASAAPLEVMAALFAILAVCFWVVQAVVGRSGLADPTGSLVFFGHHATNDSLVYLAMARRIAEVGWPVDNPFIASVPNLGHALWFGELVGLGSLTGASSLDVGFRIRPLLDVSSLAITSFVLARALGARLPSALLAALLLLLGGGLSQPILLLLLRLGFEVGLHEVWGFATGFHLPFNPIAPALQTGFAALVVLARLKPDQRLAAATAGFLVACVFEIKLFLWPALLGGLLFAALVGRDPMRGLARTAASVSLLLSLPLVIQKLWFAANLEGLAPVGFEPCPGCLPEFALATATTSGGATLDVFGRGLQIGLLPYAVAASSAWAAVVLGVRWLSVPVLWRGSRGADARALALRVLSMSALLGLGAACVLAAPPHPVNVAQFAWSATFGLWIALGLALDAWLRTERRLASLVVAGVVLLALPSGLFFLLSQGTAAPVFARVGAEEQALFQSLDREDLPGELLVEPSILQNAAQLAPAAWLGGVPVYLSHAGMALYLAPAERELRRTRIETIFSTRDRGEGLASIRDTGADYVYSTAEQPLRFDPRPALEIVATNASGTIWRVVPTGPTPVLGSSE